MPGNYAAEIYAYCAEEASVRMDISSDDPFAVFCNDDPVAFRSETRQLDLYDRPDAPRIGNEVLQSFTLRLKAVLAFSSLRLYHALISLDGGNHDS